MSTVPSKIAARIAARIKQYQPVVAAARSRDINESDTVTIITDMLSDIFGYDKYADITSEHAIRGTYCDLAIKLDGHLAILIEVKSIGSELKDHYVKQAVDYAANEGTEWVVLTNAALWRVYHVTFGKPICHELVLEFSFADLNPKDMQDIELLWLLAKEGWKKARLGDYHARCQVLSRFTFGALLLTEPVVNVLRKEIKRIAPDIRVENDQISAILSQEVIKRDALEGDKADDARRLLSRTAKKLKKEVAKQADLTQTVGENIGVDLSQPVHAEERQP